MCIVNLQRLLDDSDVFAFFYMDKVVEIQNRIYDVRGVKVMFDFDLALLYKIETRVLNQAVKRNLNRFPEDFMFQLTSFEWEQMSSQIVTTSCKRPKSAAPFVFTEHGVIMLASVLRSDTAVQASVNITRAFVSMRNYIMSSRHVEAELAELRAKLQLLERSDEDTLEALNDLSEDVRNEISAIFQAIAALSVKISPPTVSCPRNKIGFKTSADEKK